MTISLNQRDIETYKVRLRKLQTEHRELDQAIIQLAKAPSADQLELHRLKKRKLLLKDMMAYLEQQLAVNTGA